MRFFGAATRNLIQYEQAAGVRHHVALSVVGTGHLAKKRPSDAEKTIRGYFRAKLAQEKLIASLPFHFRLSTRPSSSSFSRILQMLRATYNNSLSTGDHPADGGEDVAAELGRVAVGTPVNGIIEVAGPEQSRLDEFIRQGLRFQSDPRSVVADPRAGYFGVESRRAHARSN